MVIPEDKTLEGFSGRERDAMDYETPRESEFFEDEAEEDENSRLSERIKEWYKKERVSQKIKRIGM